MSTRGRFWQLTLFGLVVALLFPALALAGHFAIDTNDGAVDADWASVSATVLDGEDVAVDHFDIQQGWITNDDDYVYLRLQLYNGGRLPTNYAVAARLDCDRNGSFVDNEVDAIAWYRRDTDVPMECEGLAGTTHCHNQPGTTRETNDATYGEEILDGGLYNYEWRADINEGAVDWSHCGGDVDVVFVTADLGASLERDITEPIHYNVPTVVSVSRFSAQADRSRQAIYGAGIAALVVSGAALLLGRRKSQAQG